MRKLKKILIERIAGGLKRKSLTKISEWAEMYRIMGPPFPGSCNFDHHPWSREMCDATEELIVGQKAAQMAYTEVALNRTFAPIDLWGESVLYVLPAKTPDASDFSTSRFDPALESSPHLAQLFTDVKNIGHKRAGHANLFIRGSRSRSQLKSVPVGRIIFDEVAEMMQANIPLAFERISGQLDKSIFMISTPTITNADINAWFNDSTQDHFFFKCPHCSRWSELIFPECLIITSEDYKSKDIYDTHLICKECKHLLNHNTKMEWLADGRWEHSFPDRVSRGFYINQLYSMTVKPHELGVAYLKSLINPTDEQEFHNSKLGLPHEVEGAKISETDIANCQQKGGHKQLKHIGIDNLVTMGVDVGKWLHYEICTWHLSDKAVTTNDISLLATPTVIKEGKVLEFEELDELIKIFYINCCIVDIDPETRKTFEFAQRWGGIVKRCRYTEGVNARHLILDPNEEEHYIRADRTSWMDLALGRFHTGKIILPSDLSSEYKQQVQAPVRVYKRDRNGNPVGRYVKKDNDHDHAAHARVYSEIGLMFAASLMESYDMEGII